MGLKFNLFAYCGFKGVNSSPMNLNTIEPLTRMNYKKWKQDLEIVLGVRDMDLALGVMNHCYPMKDAQQFKGPIMRNGIKQTESLS